MKKALLVIDVQNIYTNRDSELFCRDSKKTTERINQIITGFESKKLPIIYVRHIHKEDGSDLGRMFDYSGEFEGFNFKENSIDVEFDSNLVQVENSYKIVKKRYSAFERTDLDQYLKKNNIERIVIVGFMTNFCCESTAREAHDKDYYVDFVIDATGTPGTDNLDEKEIRKIVAELLKSGFATIYKTKDYINNI